MITALFVFVTHEAYTITDDHELNIDYIKKEIKALKIDFPEITLRMILLESGYLTSNLAVQHNNLFGMKVPRQRTSTAVGETSSGFARYNSVRASLVDFRIWQLYYTKGMNREEYLKYLRTVYAPNQKYIKKVFGVSI